MKRMKEREEQYSLDKTMERRKEKEEQYSLDKTMKRREREMLSICSTRP